MSGYTCHRDFLLDFNENFRKNGISKKKCKKSVNGDRKNADVSKNSDVIEFFFMELKNRIVVLHFGRFWAYRSVQGRFQIGGGTFAPPWGMGVSKYPMGNRVNKVCKRATKTMGNI